MPSFGVALAWIIISPLAFLTDCLGVLIILHYKPLYHSCDVAFISIFLTMATNAGLLLPIPAVVKLGDFYWSNSLCTFYTWLSVTLRSSHLLVLLAVNVYWMASLRVSPRNRMFTSSKPMKVSVCVCWFISIVAGLIPAADTSQTFHFHEDNACKFLPTSISIGFAIFFIIISLLSSVMGVISSLDTLLVFRIMKDVALSKYSADRFHVPTISGRLQTSALIHAKYNELNVSLELCRLVLWFSVASSVLNAIPLLASQFVQLIQEYDRETMETTLLWLLLIESLTLPHLLWLLSRRYRHATVYTWRVFVLRDNSIKEEDTASCTLQAFRLKVKDVTSRTYLNGISRQFQLNGTVHRPGIEDSNDDITPDVEDGTPVSRTTRLVDRGQGEGRGNGVQGAHIASTDFEDGLTAVGRLTSTEAIVLHDNSRLEKVHTQQVHQSHNKHIQETSLTSKLQHEMDDKPKTDPSHHVTPQGTRANNIISTSPTSASPSKPPLSMSGFKAREVTRSTSASSRKEWKERMRKKHLPTAFLTESLDNDAGSASINNSEDHTEKDASKTNKVDEIINSDAVSSRRRDTMSHVSNNWTSTESTYYLSSDFHYDYINDTLSRSHPQTVFETDDLSRKYEDEDFGHILDDSLASEKSEYGINHRDNASNNLSQSLGIDQHFTNHNMRQSEVATSQNSDMNILPSVVAQHEEGNTKANKHYGNNHNLLDNAGNIFSEAESEEYSTNLLGYHSMPGDSESALQSKTDGERFSFRYPNIHKNNYRKFLSYTNLIISKVDDVDVDNSEENNDGRAYSKEEDSICEPGYDDESSKSTVSIHNESGSDMTNTSSSLPGESQALRKPPTGNIGGADAKLSTAVTEDYLQDYGNLNTVSGSEMLRLKMKSLRPAMAIYNSDDTTSEEGGIDNGGFDDTSDDGDEGNEENRKRTWSSNPQNINIQNRPQVKLRPFGSNGFIPSTLSLDNNGDEFVDETLGRNYVGDGEESAFSSSPSGKTFVTDVRPRSSNYEPEGKAHEGYPAIKSFPVTESAASNQLIQTKNQFTKQFDKNISQSPEHKSGFYSQEHTSITNSLPKIELEYDRHSSGGSYSERSASAKQKPEPSFQRLPAGSDSVMKKNLDLASSAIPISPGKVPAPIIKPPRHRKLSGESSLVRLSSLEDEFDSTFHDPKERKYATITNIQHSNTVNSVIPKEEDDIGEHSDASEAVETESNGSEHSVTVEPYDHRRRLAWMNDALVSSSYGHNIVFPDKINNKEGHEILNRDEIRTDFISNYNRDIRNDAVEYDLDSMNIGDVKSRVHNVTRDQSSTSNHFQEPILQYHFDEDTDESFDNALAMDYIANSNIYRSRNLYFESIKEEPEESLSDNASSFELSDTITSKDFKPTPAFPSLPVSRTNVTSYSPLDTAHRIDEGNNELTSSHDSHFNQSSFNTLNRKLSFLTYERTSADGSEETSPAYTINSKPQLAQLNVTSTSGTTTTKREPHYPQSTFAETDNPMGTSVNLWTGPTLATPNSFELQDSDSSDTKPHNNNKKYDNLSKSKLYQKDKSNLEVVRIRNLEKVEQNSHTNMSDAVTTSQSLNMKPSILTSADSTSVYF